MFSELKVRSVLKLSWHSLGPFIQSSGLKSTPACLGFERPTNRGEAIWAVILIGSPRATAKGQEHNIFSCPLGFRSSSEANGGAGPCSGANIRGSVCSKVQVGSFLTTVLICVIGMIFLTGLPPRSQVYSMRSRRCIDIPQFY